MRQCLRHIATSALLATSFSAAASDGHGLATFLFGVPFLLILSLLLGFLLTLPPTKKTEVVAVVCFAAVFLYSLYIVTDALTLFRRGFSQDSMIGIAFFGLLALAGALLYKLLRKRSAKAHL